jgi:hypothetical protein
MNIRLSLCLFFSLLFISLSAQTKLRIYGYVVDENNRGVEFANVLIENTNRGAITNKNGFYEFNTTVTDSVSLVFSSVGYKTLKHTIRPSQAVLQISVILPSLDKQIGQVTVLGQRRQTSTMDLLDASKLRLIPNTSGGIESILITFAGVSSTNELSSQYNVRGGNYDENIVYVNGIEVYRPLLVKSGQQEGLSFINPDMVKNVSFSSGGFDAKYGDKMSSVLDIEYKKPSKFEATTSMSLLGASAFVGSSNKRFSQMHGLRYKTQGYLLGTLDTKGEYNPVFFDYQTYLTYQLAPKWEMTFLGNVSQNSYQFKPTVRETDFGTINQPLKLKVYFEGQEKDLFRTAFGAFTLNFRPTTQFKLSLLASAFNTNENQTSDILGEYKLSEISMDPSTGKKSTGALLGIGNYHQHARNALNATVANVSHLGEFNSEVHKMRWGVTLQKELIADKMSEWEWRDSAGYSLPYSDKQVNLFYNLKAKNDLSSFRTTAFWQDTYRWESKLGRMSFTGGLRSNYWTFNKELLVSPRFAISLLPAWKSDYSFRFATGLYYQSPFYKEFRDTLSDVNGIVHVQLNSDIKSQRSLHFVLGGDHYFRAWGRPFKFTTEAYLKLADRMIFYTVDNVQIRYSAHNDTKAYTTGIDFKLSGELVPGAESWLNFSLMSAKQNLLLDVNNYSASDPRSKTLGVNSLYTGWMSSPTEQQYTFSCLFQDYWPTNSNYKVQLKFIWSDGLPYGSPSKLAYSTSNRAPAYRRVDIGGSRLLVSSTDELLTKPAFRHIKSIWLNLEVFNLFSVKNVSSYYWVNHISGQQLAAPNYLTDRIYNVKLIVDFK